MAGGTFNGGASSLGAAFADVLQVAIASAAAERIAALDLSEVELLDIQGVASLLKVGRRQARRIMVEADPDAFQLHGERSLRWSVAQVRAAIAKKKVRIRP